MANSVYPALLQFQQLFLTDRQQLGGNHSTQLATKGNARLADKGSAHWVSREPVSASSMQVFM
jgi:hypothetical protein